MLFAQKLKQMKKELDVSQKELCSLLYNVPHRTLQSWLQGDKEPPTYVQNLIAFKLNNEINDKS